MGIVFSAIRPSKLCKVLLPFVLLILAGCSTKAYSGPELPPAQLSELTVRSSGDAVIEGITLDGNPFHSWSSEYQILPGVHQISVRYRLEEAPRRCSGGYCDAAVQYGTCSGSITTRTQRSYLVTVRDQHGYVSASALAKSYLDFSVREDEPSIGTISCSVEQTFDRVIIDPMR